MRLWDLRRFGLLGLFVGLALQLLLLVLLPKLCSFFPEGCLLEGVIQKLLCFVWLGLPAFIDCILRLGYSIWLGLIDIVILLLLLPQILPPDE
jgi:hypothetical protein